MSVLLPWHLHNNLEVLLWIQTIPPRATQNSEGKPVSGLQPTTHPIATHLFLPPWRASHEAYGFPSSVYTPWRSIRPRGGSTVASPALSRTNPRKRPIQALNVCSEPFGQGIWVLWHTESDLKGELGLWVNLRQVHLRWGDIQRKARARHGTLITTTSI